MDLDTIDHAWACVAAHCLKKAATDFKRYVKEGKNKEVAHELCSQERFIASKVRHHLRRQFVFIYLILLMKCAGSLYRLYLSQF